MKRKQSTSSILSDSGVAEAEKESKIVSQTVRKLFQSPPLYYEYSSLSSGFALRFSIPRFRFDPYSNNRFVQMATMNSRNAQYSGDQIMVQTRADGTCVPKRYVVTLLICLGSSVVYLLHVNISMAIVDMTSKRVVASANGSYEREADFDWDSREEGLILSASSYGILASPLGGVLGSRYGGATVFGLIILVNAVSTIAVPFLLRLNLWLFILQRLLDGVVQGLVPACVMEICAHWAPPEERSRIIVCSIVGLYLGTAYSYPLCGFVAQLFGWPAVFYVSGAITIVWYVVWVAFVSDDPSTDRFISQHEKDYLKACVDRAPDNQVAYPWKSILTSKAVWAYVNEFFVLGWSFSFIIFGLPLYVKDMLNVPIDDIGLLSSIPDLCTLISLPMAAVIADYLRINKILSVPNVHKVFITFGKLSAIVLLILIAIGFDFTLSITLFSLFRFFYSFAEASYEVLPVDMAPYHSGLIRGLATTGQAVSLILSPTIMGFMVSNHTRQEWGLYFLFLCTLNVWGIIVYFIFGSGDVQPWAIIEKKTTTTDEKVVGAPTDAS
ncbi:hypothetical protein V9T40_001269 [Parthenolecanium corni]|uniref:Major facilitator superfamily (MFS) profile domain-containing protein n=1 Tax=Parthenolecanium corni TaxID=536013 RepID=A0AAN9TD76_9HEMI